MTKENKLQKLWVVCILALCCCLLWGSAFPCIKIGYEMFHIQQGDTPSIILFAGLRFILAGVLTIIMGSAVRRKILVPSRKSVRKIATISMFQTVIQYFFFYIGLSLTTGTNASIIDATSVFAAICISAVIYKQERLSAGKIVGCIIGFFGVVLVNNMSPEDVKNVKIGDLLIFIAALSYAMSSVLTKVFSKDEDPVMISGYQFLMGGAIMASVAFLMGGRLETVTEKGLLLLLYLAFISAGAYSVWGILLKYNSVSRVTIFGFMNPVFGVILSALLLDESADMGIKGAAALILVSIGIFTVNCGGKKANETAD